MKIRTLPVKKLWVPITFVALLVYFVTGNLSGGDKDLPLYSECFSGSSLPSTIVGTKDAPKIALAGSEGYVTYGPYITLNPGEYRVSLSYSAEFEGTNPVIGYVDRAFGPGAEPGSAIDITPDSPGINQMEVTFSAKSILNGFEFRVFSNGKSTMEVKELCINQTE